MNQEQRLQWAFEQNMSPEGKLVLIALAALSDSNGETAAPIHAVASMTSLSEHDALEELEALVAAKLLSHEARGAVERYKLALPASVADEMLHQTGSDTPAHTPRVITDLNLHEVSVVLDPPHPSWRIESSVQIPPEIKQ